MENISQQDLIETFKQFHSDDNHLRPIDLLIKHRELFGFSVLDSIDGLIAACLAAGPQQTHLERPLKDDGAALIQEFQEIAAMRKFCQEEMKFVLDLVRRHHSHNVGDEIGTTDFMARYVPRLMRVRGIIKWARDADSRHLRIRLHALQLQPHVAPNGVVTPPIFPSSFKIRITVLWKTVLGKEKKEVYLTGPEPFLAPDLGGCTTTPSNQNHNNQTSTCSFQNYNDDMLGGNRISSGTFSAGSSNQNSPQGSSNTFLSAPPSSLFGQSSSSSLFEPHHQHNELNNNSTHVLSNSVAAMSCDQSAPSTQPFVNLATVFRTGCDGSCTIRVSVETTGGIEFAKGSVRASFLPGDGAPCASFSVPLIRHSSLLLGTKNAKSTSSSSSSKTTGEEKSSKSGGRADREVAKRNKQALEAMKNTPPSNDGGLNINNASSSSALSSNAVLNRHQRANSLENASNEHLTVGSISIDIDSIASSFLNLVATKKQQEMFAEREKRRREESKEFDEDDSSSADNAKTGNEEEKEESTEKDNIDDDSSKVDDDERMTVLYYLKKDEDDED